MFKDKATWVILALSFAIVVGIFLYMTGKKGEKEYNVTTKKANFESIMKQLEQCEVIMFDNKLTFFKKDNQILAIEVSIQNQLKYDAGLTVDQEAQVWSKMKKIFKAMKEYETNKRNKRLRRLDD